MEFKDYYKILGVESDADPKAIKIAYRKLAHQYHPDMNPDTGAEEKFKDVAEAYEVLKDPQRRADFDELKKYAGQSNQGFQPPPGWRGSGNRTGGQFSGDFSDFFNSVFGDFSANFSQTRSSRRQDIRGQDVEIEMPVFLEETISDKSKTVEYKIPHDDRGQISYIKKHLKIKIPKGVVDGERIRIKGQGAPGSKNGVAGDLYLHIRLVPHPLFDVQGHNLVLTLPLAPWEAALGTKVTVPTLAGKISLTIKPNTQSGQKLRIKGKGLKAKATTGDLIAIAKIVLPETVNQQQHKLWQQLANSVNFDARAEWSN